MPATALWRSSPAPLQRRRCCGSARRWTGCGGKAKTCMNRYGRLSFCTRSTGSICPASPVLPPEARSPSEVTKSFSTVVSRKRLRRFCNASRRQVRAKLSRAGWPRPTGNSAFRHWPIRCGEVCDLLLATSGCFGSATRATIHCGSMKRYAILSATDCFRCCAKLHLCVWT